MFGLSNFLQSFAFLFSTINIPPPASGKSASSLCQLCTKHFGSVLQGQQSTNNKNCYIFIIFNTIIHLVLI